VGAGSQRIAVVDLGTNSTRLLVAEVEGGSVAELERRTDVTRLGQGVDRSGRLSDDAMERVYAVVAGYREAIDGVGGADRVIGVATSAVRDSANGQELRDVLRERFGVAVETIAGDEEARLTFLGATSGRPGGAPVLVFDIGGGSTEYVVGVPRRQPHFRVSTRLGSVRQTERHLHHDPPSADQLAQLRGEARQIVADEVPEDVRREVDAAVAVAGTATSLAAIDLALDPYDPSQVHGHRLRVEGCERILERLASVGLEERRTTVGLHPDRAPTIVAGAAILIESLRAFDLEEVEVSEADILHGAALSAAGGAAEGETG
jgi:exopolyphosphatase/guanosine-5'-triphosphate,3'-diphosphate pyrophosphatase